MTGKYCAVKRRKARRIRRTAAGLVLCLILCLGILAVGGLMFAAGRALDWRPFLTAAESDSDVGGVPWVEAGQAPGGYERELEELLERNEEAADYVEGYPDRAAYLGEGIDLTEDFVSGQVPLLMQWDRRWGYNSYGDSMIGLSGCGPVCLTMAYLYLTEDTDMTPREMADFADENGYYTSQGTSWALWTDGAKKLGLRGTELSLDENIMKLALDEGGVVVCSMRPGDFTATGHFILIRGYDENGFYVNDPNRRSNSEKQWDFETLKGQIRNLWELR